ncbi:MAG: poly-beta-1,6-N-acetyl-D-glucosamine N-deacetylase PgaB, partial [Synechococcaceae bacterium WB9_3_282]|nr:poly-beta-1,6-N-acetyl-D-glucosamine N-deacetylase PgaB [Synechococcaceae bacterium WB9_3_282]
MRLGLLGLLMALLLSFTQLLPALQRPGAAAPTAGLGGLVVLGFHEIAEPAQAVIPDYSVTPEQFRAQIGWLHGHGYHFVSLDQVLQARAGQRPLPSQPVLLSFDDGYRSVYTEAFPVLKQYQAPALLALVGSWLEPEAGLVSFGDQLLPREHLLSWVQLREMVGSGLVEVASHTYDLHKGITANPQSNSEPAVTSRLYGAAKGYETEIAYRQRLRLDLERNNKLLAKQLGQRPRAVVWPYGRYNATAMAVAEGLGMPVGLTLNDGEIFNSSPLNALPRVLMTREMAGVKGMETELALRNRDAGDNTRAVKVMHVDLDNIFDPNPAQIERNLQLLLRRIREMGVNTVYLQAYADPDGNGAADAVYFPNRHLPVKADLFNHVAWEIRTRTPVRRLYAWMPVLAFELPKGHPAAQQKVVTEKPS